MKRNDRLEEISTVRPGDKLLRLRVRSRSTLHSVSKNVARMLHRRHTKQSEME